MAIAHPSKLLAGALLLGTTLSALTPAPAQAQPAYGSYIGVGLAAGQKNSTSEGLDLAGVIAGRYKLLEFPISLRGQAIIDDQSIAFVPTVSYDFPLTWQLEPYVGAGVAFTNANSVVGDKTSFVIQPGVDYSIPNSRIVLFGNAMIAIDAYNAGEKEGDTAVSVQTGLGYRF
ncbi:MAG: hypothetical protein ACO331_09815 [Prochlorothrix sp.]